MPDTDMVVVTRPLTISISINIHYASHLSSTLQDAKDLSLIIQLQ